MANGIACNFPVSEVRNMLPIFLLVIYFAFKIYSAKAFYVILLFLKLRVTTEVAKHITVINTPA
jgi:hypothetical protein